MSFRSALALALALAAPARAEIVDIASSPPDPYALGAQANETSEHYGADAFSDDTRYAVFDSRADNLVAGDDNHDYDVFLKDRQTGAITLISHRPDGRPGRGESYEGAISGNGRYVAFYSYASDLVAGDTNGKVDVFVFDRVTGALERVSVGPGGAQSDGYSYSPSLTRDGRYVLFLSAATNLVADDSNAADDIFLRDRQLDITLRVSLGNDGAQGNAAADQARIDATGRKVCFTSRASNLVADDVNGRDDVFVRDLSLATTTLISRTPGGAPGNGHSRNCAIAADSGAVAFESRASDLSANDSNGMIGSTDVFVWTGGGAPLERVDIGAGGVQGDGYTGGPDISADGRFIALESDAPNAPGPDRAGNVDIYHVDRTAQAVTRVSLASGGQAPADYSDHPRIAGNGAFVLYNAFSDDQVPGDGNRQRDAVLYNVASQLRTQLAAPPQALPSGAGGGGGSISGDGRYIAFASAAALLAPGQANGLTQVYLYDSGSGTLEMVSRTAAGVAGNGDSYDASVSADGRYVAYLSRATNLVATPDANGGYDVFLFDRALGTTQRVTHDALGNAPDRASSLLAMSADASRIAFVSPAGNIIPGATGFAYRIVVWDRAGDSFRQGDAAADGTPSNAAALDRPALSADGRFLAFASQGTVFVANDGNVYADVFRKDLTTGAVLRASQRSDGGAADQHSAQPTLSADGRFVAYRSHATNLVAGDDNGGPDVFRTDLDTGTTTRVSAGLGVSAGTIQQSPKISPDGRYVAFDASAPIAGDTNGTLDVYVADAQSGALLRASVDRDGAEYFAASSSAAISADARWLAFNVSPSVVAMPGRYNAPVGADVYKARNPFAVLVFRDGFE